MTEQHNLNIHSLIPIEQLLKTHAYIGGDWIEGDARFRVCNPRSNSGLAQVETLTEGQQRQALAAASKSLRRQDTNLRHRQIGRSADRHLDRDDQTMSQCPGTDIIRGAGLRLARRQCGGRRIDRIRKAMLAGNHGRPAILCQKPRC